MDMKEDTIAHELLRDELFIRMMLAFATHRGEVDFHGRDVLHAVADEARELHADAIVVNRFMYIEMCVVMRRVASGVDSYSCIDAEKSFCRILGIPCVVYNSYDVIPYNCILLIRDGKPTPQSWLVEFSL